MTILISQNFEPAAGGKVLLTPVHGAGIPPNIMDLLTHNDLREVLFANYQGDRNGNCKKTCC